MNIRSSHNLIIHQLESLDLNCIYCQNKYKYKKIENHILECINRKEICLNTNCNFTGTIDELKEHKCEYEPLFCPACKQEFFKLDQHNCSIYFVNKYNDIANKFEKYITILKSHDNEIKELQKYIKTSKASKEKKNNINKRRDDILDEMVSSNEDDIKLRLNSLIELSNLDQEEYSD